MGRSSVIVGSLDVAGVTFMPPKAYAELIVYSNARLACPILFSAYNRVFGGEAKSSKRIAASSSTSLRRAILAMSAPIRFSHHPFECRLGMPVTE
jgi:hypothetical protein